MGSKTRQSLGCRNFFFPEPALVGSPPGQHSIVLSHSSSEERFIPQSSGMNEKQGQAIANPTETLAQWKESSVIQISSCQITTTNRSDDSNLCLGPGSPYLGEKFELPMDDGQIG